MCGGCAWTERATEARAEEWLQEERRIALYDLATAWDPATLVGYVLEDLRASFIEKHDRYPQCLRISPTLRNYVVGLLKDGRYRRISVVDDPRCWPCGKEPEGPLGPNEHRLIMEAVDD